MPPAQLLPSCTVPGRLCVPWGPVPSLVLSFLRALQHSRGREWMGCFLQEGSCSCAGRDRAVPGSHHNPLP